MTNDKDGAAQAQDGEYWGRSIVKRITPAQLALNAYLRRLEAMMAIALPLADGFDGVNRQPAIVHRERAKALAARAYGEDGGAS